MKYNKMTFIMVSILLLPISNTINATQIDLMHHIDKVTVFPRSAMITRTSTLQLSKGSHTLVLDQLPSNLYQNSLRVSGHGAATVIIGSIDNKQVRSDVLVQDKEKKLNDQIIVLTDTITELNNDIESFQLRLAFIKNLGQNIPATINKEIKIGTVNPKMWRAAWESIGTGASESYRSILNNKKEIRHVNKKLQKLQSQLNQVRTGSRASSQARVNINVKQAGEFTLNLSYQIPGATWSPIYDARLNVNQRNILLTQYGQVRQQTGEDWTNVKLTLSTSNPTIGVEMPDLQPWFLRIQTPIIYKRAKVKKLYSQATAIIEESVVANFADSEPDQLSKELTFEYAEQTVSEFAADFAITGRSNILADNTAQKFTISENKLETTLAARVVPKKDPKAFLYAETVYSGESPLLAGPVSVFRDNTFVGNLNMDLVRPSEKIKLSFGVDDRIKVKYKLVTNDRSEKGFLSSDNLINRKYQIDISNHHSTAFDIVLLEQIPVSQDENITVEFTNTSTPPTEKNIDGRLGVMAWRYSYKANDKKKIIVGYQVRYPKDNFISGL